MRPRCFCLEGHKQDVKIKNFFVQHHIEGHGEVLRSFCIGLKGSPDIAAAERVAQHIGSNHYSFTFTVQEGLDVLSDVIYHLEVRFILNLLKIAFKKGNLSFDPV